jgi:hypothetical protein
MGQKATTDFSDSRAHGNEILNIWETADLQIYYQQDKDWFYRAEEWRRITLNDEIVGDVLAVSMDVFAGAFCTSPSRQPTKKYGL